MADLYTIGSGSDKAYKHNGFGAVNSSFSTPGISPRSATIDNNLDFYSGDWNTDKLYEHSGFTSTIDSSFSYSLGDPSSMSIDGSLDIYTSKTTKIHLHDGFSDTVSSSFSTPAGKCRGMSIDDNGDIYSGDNDADKLYLHAGFSATISTSIASPSIQQRGASVDLSFNLYSSDKDSDRLYKHSGFTTTITSSRNNPDTVGQDVDWDERITPTVVHEFAANIDADWTGSASIIPLKNFATNIDTDWSGSGALQGGLVAFAASIDADWTGSASLIGILKAFQASIDADWSGTASDLLTEMQFGANTNVDWVSIGQLTFDFSFKWSIEYLEASTSHGFPSVYVEIDNTVQPTGAFPTGTAYEKKLLEIPRLEEINLDSRFGVSGFQRVTLQVDNSDGVINVINLQDAYVRMFFVDADGTVYKEFKGKVVDWTLSHTVTINVEDIDALAFSEQLPKRTLNDLVEAEKAVDGSFENVVVADDLGKPIPIIFGRAVKAPLLYVKADETNREYDYIIGEGVGLNSNNLEEVFTSYREDKALDDIQGTMSAATSTTLTLESADKRPDSWYKYWWAEMLTGNAAGEITDVTAYDSATNKLTVSTWGTTPTSGTYRLREFRFYDGSQASPYSGYAFIRFKKRLGTTSRTDDLFADVNGLQDEINRARAIESILTNSNWGLGLTVDSASFTTADTAMTAISSLTCEGAIISETTAGDLFSKLLSFRDMVLTKEDDIKIAVDAAKTSGFNFGLGDETGYNNILNESPAINFIHPDQKVKNLKVRYRKNHKENDTYLHEFTRSSSTNGVDDKLDLPFIYDHTTADKALDYKRKRLAAADRTLPLDVGQDGASTKRGDSVTIDIPTLGLWSDWEVVGSNVTPAGSNNLSLVPYSATPYTYVAFTTEGGTLPVDESFDIPPDYSTTNPDPISNLSVTMDLEIAGDTPYPFSLLTWDSPEDNYGGAIVAVKLSSDGNSFWRDVGTFDDSARVNSLIPGLFYDFRVTSLNVTGEFKGIALAPDQIKINQLAGGDTTDPATPTGLTGTGKLGELRWKWNANSEADIEYYIIEIRTTSSTSGDPSVSFKVMHDRATDFEPFFSSNLSDGNLTSTITRYARVRAVDFSGNPTDPDDGWTSVVSATSTAVNRLDATNNDFASQTVYSNDGPITLSSGVWTEIASVTGSFLSGQKIFIHASFVYQFTADAGTPSVTTGINWRILKDGSAISGQPHCPVLRVVGDKAPVARTIDDTPGSGSHTYKIEVVSTDPLVLTTQASFRRLAINEFRR